jgi:hypothetical protein
VLGTGASGRSTQNKGARAEVQLANIKGTVFLIKCIKIVPMSLIYLNLINNPRRKSK